MFIGQEIRLSFLQIKHLWEISLSVLKFFSKDDSSFHVLWFHFRLKSFHSGHLNLVATILDNIGVQVTTKFLTIEKI